VLDALDDLVLAARGLWQAYLRLPRRAVSVELVLTPPLEPQGDAPMAFNQPDDKPILITAVFKDKLGIQTDPPVDTTWASSNPAVASVSGNGATATASPVGTPPATYQVQLTAEAGALHGLLDVTLVPGAAVTVELGAQLAP
jgi:hypothetical protein